VVEEARPFEAISAAIIKVFTCIHVIAPMAWRWYYHSGDAPLVDTLLGCSPYAKFFVITSKILTFLLFPRCILFIYLGLVDMWCKYRLMTLMGELIGCPKFSHRRALPILKLTSQARCFLLPARGRSRQHAPTSRCRRRGDQPPQGTMGRPPEITEAAETGLSDRGSVLHPHIGMGRLLGTAGTGPFGPIGPMGLSSVVYPHLWHGQTARDR
ncbi:hypothetical protein CYMTET_33690, partial [Cymbomonas tetramitiformis]